MLISKWFIFVLLGFILFLLIYYKVKIKFKTFFRRGFPAVRGNFGLYCYTGSQGSGKTYSIVEYLIDNKNKSVYFGNIAGISGIEYELINGFNGLIDLKHRLDDGTIIIPKGKQIVIFYDELFTELQKYSKLNSEVMDFLCQMRKRKIIFLTTCQYWAELPITFRRFCRYEIDCKMINLGFISILWKKFKDGENMKWSEIDQDFVAPLVSNTITKTRKYIADSYDTFLRISPVSDFSSKI